MGHLNSGQEGKSRASVMHFHDLILFFQLATTDMQTPINSMGGPEINRPTSAPPTKSLSNSNGEILQPHSSSFQSSPVVASFQGAPKGNALRLGANKASSSIAIDSLVNKLAEEAAESATIEGNPWGSDDLIDINADADDWGMLDSFSKRKEELIGFLLKVPLNPGPRMLDRPAPLT